jgi:hypothetical protein
VPITSEKNLPLTGIASDMPYGGQELTRQLQDETEQARRRRLMLNQARQFPTAPTLPGLGTGIDRGTR